MCKLKSETTADRETCDVKLVLSSPLVTVLDVQAWMEVAGLQLSSIDGGTQLSDPG